MCSSSILGLFQWKPILSSLPVLIFWNSLVAMEHCHGMNPFPPFPSYLVKSMVYVLPEGALSWLFVWRAVLVGNKLWLSPFSDGKSMFFMCNLLLLLFIFVRRSKARADSLRKALSTVVHYACMHYLCPLLGSGTLEKNLKYRYQFCNGQCLLVTSGDHRAALLYDITVRFGCPYSQCSCPN